MAAQWQININPVVSPDTVELPPARDVWDSLERRVSVAPSPPKVSFEPSPLDVEVGDQIFWTNNDSQSHWPGLLKDGSIDETFFMLNQIAGASSSPIFSPGVAGTLQYVCSLHCKAGQPCNEAGTIVVTKP